MATKCAPKSFQQGVRGYQWRQDHPQKIFTPLSTPDYGSYVAQVKSADAIFLGTAGSNGFRFLRQFIEYGLKDKMAVIGGMTALDEFGAAQHGRRGARYPDREFLFG